MSVLAACLSHTPLQGHFDPEPAVLAEVEAAVGTLRSRVAVFDPELMFLFAPDHFNGFFYDIMPQFCIATAADALGDFGTLSGPINVASAAAGDCARFLISSNIDIAVSHRMQVDHGFAGPLKDLFGSLSTPPIVPIFINSVAPPLASCHRSRLLGEVIGRFAATLDKRVLFIGSGGLSHEPPVPQIATAAPEIVERLINGRNPDEGAKAARIKRVISAASRLTEADPALKPLSPAWDEEFLALAQKGDAKVFDNLKDEAIERDAGASAHEVRTWIAALSATGAGQHYHFQRHYYRPIPEWIAGFAVASADRG
jgi:2,3-dihydroxyphenylpropionate 1,2-dioxygenase